MQTKSKTPLIVGGALTALVALAVLAGATGLLWVHAAKNDHGYLTTSAHRFHTPSRALVSTTVTLHTDLPHWLLDKVRIEATSDKPLFVGLARKRDVDAYLRGVSHATVQDVNTWPFRVTYADHAGTRVPAPAASLKIWAATSTHELRWHLKRGSWAVVLMNADGSPGVDAKVAVGAKVDSVLPTGITLAVLGGLLAALAGWLITKGSGGRAR